MTFEITSNAIQKPYTNIGVDIPKDDGLPRSEKPLITMMHVHLDVTNRELVSKASPSGTVCHGRCLRLTAQEDQVDVPPQTCKDRIKIGSL